MVINYLLEYIKGETAIECFTNSKKKKLDNDFDISTEKGKTYFYNLIDQLLNSVDKVEKGQPFYIQAGE